MKKYTEIFFIVPIILLVATCSEPVETGLWQIFELSIKNRKVYPDPFEDVTLKVTYKRPDGRKVEFPGFYAGKHTWKIRFMPDQTGIWEYSAAFSDRDLQITGKFICKESEVPGMITLYRDNPLWFGFDSGKAVMLRSFHAGDRFFADTSNLVTGEEWSDEHRTRFLDWLQENRYNMLSIGSHYLNRNTSGRGKGWRTPDLWDSIREMPSPQEFDRMEKILNELSDREIIIFPFAGFLGRDSDFPADPDKQDTFIRYTVARLSPYWNIIFNIGGPEPTLKNHPYLNNEQIIETGKKISEADIFGHLLTVHCPTGDSEFKDEPWLDFVTLQGPKTTNRKELYEGLLRNHPDRKGLYAQETIWPGNKHHPLYSNDDIRKNIIIAIMSAAMINFADMNGNSSSGFSGNLNPDSANKTIHQIFHQTLDFFEKHEFQRFRPNNDVIENGYCLVSTDKEYLIYVEEVDTISVDIEPGHYKGTWISAHNFEETIFTIEMRDKEQLFSPDDNKDWFLKLAILK